jgi:hypothetical protein
MKPQGYSVNVNYLLTTHYQNLRQNKNFVTTLKPNPELKENLSVLYCTGPETQLPYIS